MANKTYTDPELKQKMSLAIDEMIAVLESDEETANQKTQAANALSGLVQRYKKLFNTAPEKGDKKLKSVKNF
jgi:hypothetical protein